MISTTTRRRLSSDVTRLLHPAMSSSPPSTAMGSVLYSQLTLMTLSSRAVSVVLHAILEFVCVICIVSVMFDVLGLVFVLHRVGNPFVLQPIEARTIQAPLATLALYDHTNSPQRRCDVFVAAFDGTRWTHITDIPVTSYGGGALHLSVTTLPTCQRVTRFLYQVRCADVAVDVSPLAGHYINGDMINTQRIFHVRSVPPHRKQCPRDDATAIRARDVCTIPYRIDASGGRNHTIVYAPWTWSDLATSSRNESTLYWKVVTWAHTNAYRYNAPHIRRRLRRCLILTLVASITCTVALARIML